VEGFATDVGFMIEKIKEDYFVFIKRKDKRYRYKDKLDSKKIRQPFLGNNARKLVSIS
jgi:hypothetical protein